MTTECILTVRLREGAPQVGHYGAHGASVLMIQAAEEIEILRASLAASAARIKDLETTIAHMSREGHL